MLYITSHHQGAILNHNHGKETSQGLTILVQGICDSCTPVTVNGVPATMDGTHFEAEITLTQKINSVIASTYTRNGSFSQELTLVWDKASFKRSGFYLDDHIFLFEDLAKERPARAFDHFYLAHLKKLHREYGLKATLNCFYENTEGDFNLTMMPDTWKSEFTDNSDWLRFSFHSKAEFPDRPYAEATPEEFGRDWDMVQNEIERFAGKPSFIPPVVIHWANVHPAVAQECIRRGVKAYFMSFRLRVMGGPSLADRQKGASNYAEVQCRSISGADKASPSEAFDLHYGFAEEKPYLTKHIAYYDPALKVFFFINSACCNLVPLKDIVPRLEAYFNNAAISGAEAFNLATHEQYSFPRYFNYLPDHLERIELATRTMHEHGCKFVFNNEGILGNI